MRCLGIQVDVCYSVYVRIFLYVLGRTCLEEASEKERKKGQCGFLVRLARPAVLVGVTDGV